MADQERPASRGRGRPIQLRAQTDQAAALARWLQQFTAWETIRSLADGCRAAPPV